MKSCPHDNLVIEPPCCLGTDCDCHGQYFIYCPDCENTELTEKEIEDRLESSLDQGED